ncbi:MFS transporter [Leifsonia sp. NPDC077715]|uniref:MFS transporter n=1 Tax=Leifsonia sp. NPDC077715 TaxID=3155539 RepID=UPI0034203B1F
MNRTRRADVWLLGAGELFASLGQQFALFVVPLIAVTQFGASPLEMGVLNLLDSAAALSFGLAIGTAIDRLGGVLGLALAEGVRVASLAILLFSLLTAPSLVSLYIAMFVLGAASLMREAGTSAAVVELGTRSSRSLNRLNALLRGSAVVSETAGPGVAGFVVVAVGLTLSLLGGVLAFALAGICSLVLLHIGRARASTVVPGVLVGVSAGGSTKNTEIEASRDDVRNNGRKGGIATGLRYIWSHPLLRPLVLSSIQFNFFTAALQAVLLVYCVSTMRFSTGDLAVVGVAAGVGALAGSVLAASSLVNRRQKAWYLGALAFPALAIVLILAAQWQDHTVAVATVSVAEFLWASAIVMCVVLFNTLRQLASPEDLVGQVAASERVLAVGGEVPGALLGGIIGTLVSLDLVMVTAMLGVGLSILWAPRVPDWSTWDHTTTLATGTGVVGGRP